MTASNFSASRRQLLAASLASVATLGTLGASNAAWAQDGQRVLRIGYQQGWLSILKQRGTLEKRSVCSVKRSAARLPLPGSRASAMPT